MQAQIGPISEGTLRTQDLLEAFTDALEALDTEGIHAGIVADVDELLDTDPDEWTDGQDEDAAGNLALVFDALQDYAPPFCYFGAHEGDGACFGFFVDHDAIEEAVRSGEALKVEDSADIPEGETRPVFLVSDHGNLTLLQPHIEYREVWGVV